MIMKTSVSKRIYAVCVAGICTALSVALIFLLRFPIFPSMAILEYDMGDIPIYFSTALFGPMFGLAVTVIASAVQGLTVSAASGWIGVLMHIFATGSFVLVYGLVLEPKLLTTGEGRRRFLHIFSGITAKRHSVGRLAAAGVAGTLTTAAIMILWNLIFTPMFYGMPMSAVIPMLPVIIAFNLIKAGVNGTVSILIYKPLQKIFNKSFT